VIYPDTKIFQEFNLVTLIMDHRTYY